MSQDKAKRRAALLERDGPNCFYCRRVLRLRVYRRYGRSAMGADWTIDHIVPRSERGDNDLGNQVLACADCNHERGVAPADEFLRSRMSLPASPAA